MRTFESFVPGETLGEVTLPPPLESWRHLFPRQAEYEHVPTGFLVAVMRRGYIAIIGKRPDGPLVRKHCAWPKVAHYMGKGEPNDPANWKCMAET